MLFVTAMGADNVETQAGLSALTVFGCPPLQTAWPDAELC